MQGDSTPKPAKPTGYQKKPSTLNGPTELHRESPRSSKRCRRCERELPIESFPWNLYSSGRWYRASRCAECRRELSREGWIKNKAGNLDTLLRRKYGITLAQYQAMLAAQDGVCAICRRPERSIDPRTNAPRRLAVDHDHDTGLPRGLLCCPCNQAIGQLQHDPAVLRAAIEYLNQHAPR